MKLIFNKPFTKAVCPVNKQHVCYVDTQQQRIICFSCGINIPLKTYLSFYNIFIDKPQTGFHAEVLQVLNEAKKIYQQQLLKRKDVIMYLLQRGLREETIVRWGIGYAPDGDIIYSTLKKYFSSDVLVKSSLCYMDNKFEIHDALKNRIVFPIFNQNNEIVSFSGRIYQRKSMSKFKNLRNSCVYKRNQHLYGEHLLNTFPNEKIFIVEGFWDTIILNQEGYPCVGVFGCSLSLEQYVKIKNFNEKYLVFDGDKPGQEAMLKIVKQYKDFSFKLVSLPENTDPDELLIQGEELFDKCIQEGQDIYQILLNMNSQERVNFIKEII